MKKKSKNPEIQVFSKLPYKIFYDNIFLKIVVRVFMICLDYWIIGLI